MLYTYIRILAVIVYIHSLQKKYCMRYTYIHMCFSCIFNIYIFVKLTAEPFHQTKGDFFPRVNQDIVRKTYDVDNI